MEAIMERYVALDVHKRYCMVGAVDREQQIVLQPRKVTLEALEGWAKRHLSKTDAVVFEASVNAWELYDLLAPLVAKVSIAHPQKVKLIAASVVKTDKRDTLALAHLLAAKLIPEIWIAPRHVRELRGLVAHRQRLLSARTAAKNRLQDILHRHQVIAPAGDLYGEKNRAWWASLTLPASERLRVRHLFETIGRVSEQILETERELAHLSVDPLWRTNVTLLIQLPGIGMLTAMTIFECRGGHSAL